GDELVMPGRPLGHAQIHDSNGFSLAALAAEAGASLVHAPLPFRHVRDDRGVLREVLLAAAADADVIITSGGVSAGEKDLLPALLAELGEVVFWKVRMRPGMPVLCGTLGRTVVVGLPGNPVSGVVTFLLFVRPLLRALQGIAEPSSPRLHARLSAPIAKRHDRAEFMRARLEPHADGTLGVRVLPKQGSGMLHGVVVADALVVVPEDVRELDTGHVVEVIALPAGY
ncbi:MAG: molybdopterin molybdenumtransferase MoeA, partial [Luteimonas sp.]|nr:molybdopterin molybdenumtransferase MoeA [Luteimonas sp.]